MRTVVVALQSPFIANESSFLKKNPQSLSVCFSRGDRKAGWERLFLEGRRFLIDILTLVAVALRRFFGFQRGLEGFGFGPVLVDLVGILVLCLSFAY